MTEATKGCVKTGTTLIADEGFTCIKEGALLEVQADHEGDLYVPCKHGAHYLDGQLDEDIFTYVGLMVFRK
jgi:hypothetical protein